MADLAGMAAALERGDRDTVVQLVQGAIKEGVKPEQVLDKGLIVGMESIGRKFKANEVYVPEVLIAARAMAAGMQILEPLLTASGIKPRGKVVVGTVKQDLHDIGKNLVAMMLKGGGYHVTDVGVDVDPAKFVEAAKEANADIVAISALLTTTMPNMKTVVDVLKQAGLKVKVMIGGAPVTQGFADEIGADGYAPDAASAVDLARSLLGAA
ncbi:MAG TPA: corrinoid protein [Phycisphaerae bacterium]|nr:corrinoid protein [Phycisphaerae bacterium]